MSYSPSESNVYPLRALCLWQHKTHRNKNNN